MDEKEFEGTLTAFDGNEVTIEIKIKTRKKTVEIPYEKVAKARLAISSLKNTVIIINLRGINHEQ